MLISCKSNNEQDCEIQFTRLGGSLIVSILNFHGETFYTMTVEEIESLKLFLKISDDWMD